MDGNFTRIPNTIIKDNTELTSKELLIATILLTTLNSKNICVFNMQSIYDILQIKEKNTRAKKEIKNILKLLNEIDLFVYYDNIFLTNEIDIEAIDKNKIIYGFLNDYIEGFTILKDEEIHNIIKYSKENKIDESLLLNTLIYILSFISENEKDENYKLSFPSIINVATNINITEKSVLKYINILRDLNILVFDYVGIKEDRNGSIKNTNMFYARIEDEDKLLNKLRIERNKKGFIIQSKLNRDKSNLKRKLKQEINYLNNKSNLIDLEIEKLNKLKEEYNNLLNE